MTVAIGKRVFSVTEYHQMVEAGILTENDKIELINGEIITMSPVGSIHAGCVNRLSALLSTMLQKQAIVSIQNPIQADDYSEPEPDLAMLKPRSDFYSESHPQPADVLIVIEVSDSTLDFDKEVKLPLYAKAGISEAWIINLPEKTVEIYTTPQTGIYRKLELFKADERLVTSAFSQLSITADQVLG